MNTIYDEIYKTINVESKQHGENNDCLVRALALVRNISYDDAHKICKIAGRPKGRGWYLSRVLQTLEELGVTKKIHLTYSKLLNIASEKGWKEITPNRFIMMFPKGRFYCTQRGHAFAIIDGKTYGALSDRCFLTNVVEFEE